MTARNTETGALDALLLEVLEGVDAGDPVDRERVLRENPEFADELREFFDGERLIENLAGPLYGTDEAAGAETIAVDRPPEFDEADRKRETTPTGVGDSRLAGRPVSGDEVGETFGRYRILRTLGEGAMGSVHLAEDTMLQRHVALKLPKFGDDDPELLERFLVEARAAANLRHPNICPVHDVGEEGGRYFITMAYIPGRPLSDYAKRARRQRLRQVVKVVRKLALALHAAHEAGVVHRDVKPANVMIDEHGEPIVMDFGLARQTTNEEVRLTKSGAIMGTPAYMSPEQVEGRIDDVGPASDQFSLGAVLYEMITGELPFPGQSMGLVMSRILNDEPAAASTLRPDVDPELEAICTRMLSKPVGDRFDSLADVAAALNDWLQHDKDRKSAVGAPSATAPFVPPGESGIDMDDDEPNRVTQVEEPEPQPTPKRKKKRKKKRKQRSPQTPTPSPVAPPRSPKPPRIWIAGGLGAAAAVILGLVFLLRTPYGTLKITVDDPRLTVVVEGDESPTITLTDGKGYERRRRAGKHQLSVMIGETSLPLGRETIVRLDGEDRTVKLDVSGVTLSGNEFRIERNGETTVTIKLIDGPPAEAAGDAPPTSRSPSPRFALEFERRNTDPVDQVEIPSLKLDLSRPLTIEAVVTPEQLSSEKLLPICSLVAEQPGDQVVVGVFSVGWFVRTRRDGVETMTLWKDGVEDGKSRHVAAVWNGAEMKLYMDGSSVGVDTKLPRVVGPAMATSRIGVHGGPFVGRIEEFRVSRGAVYTGTFTPQREFEADKDTIALYHFDEGQGQVLKDSSGNGHHGEVVGAKWVRVERGGHVHPADSTGALPTGPATVRAILELNAGDYNTAPWPSEDGLRLYWEANSPTGAWEGTRVVTASRPSTSERFGHVKVVSQGRSPTLSADEKVLVCLYGSPELLCWSSRRQTSARFRQPLPIREGLDRIETPKSPFLSDDDHMLVVQGGPAGHIEFLQSRKTKHASVRPVPKTLLGMTEREHGTPISWPFLSDDGLRIWFCRGSDRESEVWTGTRPSTEVPFGDFESVRVGGKTLVGKAPRYVAATNELFLSRPSGTNAWELAIVEHYRPDVERRASVRLDRFAGNPRDLLAGIDVEKHAVMGEWQRTEAGLVTPADWRSRIKIPYEPPEEYELNIDVEQPDSGEPGMIGVGLVVGGRQVLVALDAFPDLQPPGRTGLQQIDGNSLTQGEATRTGFAMIPGRSNAIRCRVTRRLPPGEYRVLVTANGKTVVDWSGAASRLSNDDRFDVESPKSLFLTSGAEGATITRLELRQPSADNGEAADLPASAFVYDGHAYGVQERVRLGFDDNLIDEDDPTTDVDGLTMVLTRNGYLCATERGTIDDEWPRPEVIKGGVVTLGKDASPLISADGSKLVFASDRITGSPRRIHFTTRQARGGKWAHVVPLAEEIRGEPFGLIDEDRTLVFLPREGAKLMAATWDRDAETWIDPVEWTEPGLVTDARRGHFSADGTLFAFTRAEPPDGKRVQLWVQARGEDGTWLPPRVVEQVGRAEFIGRPSVALGGRAIYYTKKKPARDHVPGSNEQFQTEVFAVPRWPVDGVAASNNVGGPLERQPRATFTGHAGTARDVTFTPDGRTLVSASYDKTIRLWDVATGRELAALQNSDLVYSVDVSPDGKWLVSAGKTGTCRLWNLEERRHARDLFDQTGLLYTAEFSPDGKYVGSGTSNGKTYLHPVEDGETRKLDLRTEGVRAVRFSSDGKRLLSIGYTGDVVLVDPLVDGTATVLGTIDEARGTDLQWLTNDVALTSSDDLVLREWNLAKGTSRDVLRVEGPRFDAFTVLPDRKHVAVVSTEGQVQVHELATGRLVRRLVGFTGMPMAVAVSPDGRTLAAACKDRTIRLWDVSDMGRQ